MTTSIVTGGAGLLGSHVTEHLLRMGHRVIVLDDLSGGFIENVPRGAEFVQGDINDVQMVNELFARWQPDYCFHLAAYAAEGLSHFIKRYNYLNNLVGSCNIINAAVNYGCRGLVVTSSMAVYGHGRPPFAEWQTPCPADPYGIAKLAVEQELRVTHEMFGLPYIIFRPHNVIGERQNLCLAEGTPILTGRGWVPVEQMCDSDTTVLDGDLHRVGRLYRNGKQSCFKLTTNLGISVVATANHQFRGVDANGNLKWQRVDQFCVGDWIPIAMEEEAWPEEKTITWKYEVPDLADRAKGVRKRFCAPLSLGRDWGSLLGLLIGDGTNGDKYEIMLAVNDMDEGDARGIIRRTLNVDPYRSRGFLRTSSVEAVGFLRQLGLSSAIGENKHTPASIEKGTREFVAGYLAGLFSADGWVTKDRVGLAMIAESVVNDVQRHLLRFGIISTIVRKEPKAGGVICDHLVSGRKPQYHLIISDSLSLSRFRDRVGFAYLRKQNALNDMTLHSPTGFRVPISIGKRIVATWRLLAGSANRNQTVRVLQESLRVAERRGYGSVRSLLVDRAVSCMAVYCCDALLAWRKSIQHLAFATVVSVESVGERETYCPEVDVVHEFVAGGFRSSNSDPYRNVVGIFMNQCLKGEPMTIFGDGTQERAFSYIDDVAPIIAESITNERAWGQTINIGSDEWRTVNELSEMVAGAMGTPYLVEYLDARSEVHAAYSDHAKLRDLFGDRTTTPLVDGLAKMAEWAKQRGPQETKPFAGIEIMKNLPAKWAALVGQ